MQRHHSRETEITGGENFRFGAPGCEKPGSFQKRGGKPQVQSSERGFKVGDAVWGTTMTQGEPGGTGTEPMAFGGQ